MWISKRDYEVLQSCVDSDVCLPSFPVALRIIHNFFFIWKEEGSANLQLKMYTKNVYTERKKKVSTESKVFFFAVKWGFI
jgi:hypothetical protein